MKNNIIAETTVKVGLRNLDEVNNLVTILLANKIIDFKIHEGGYINDHSVNYLVIFVTSDYALVDLLNRLNWIK